MLAVTNFFKLLKVQGVPKMGYFSSIDNLHYHTKPKLMKELKVSLKT